MKNSFLVPIVFILNFCLWLIAGSLFVSIWKYLSFGHGNASFFLATFLHSIYFLSPIACALAIFSGFVFFMRHPSKAWLSAMMLIMIVSVFVSLVLPFMFSKGNQIDSYLNSQEKKYIDDPYLAEFIEIPDFVEAINNATFPFLNDIYKIYKENYTKYLIFSGSFFLLILSFWVCTVCLDWKIINICFLPFFLISTLLGYSYIKNSNLIDLILKITPFSIEDFFVIPMCFAVIAFLFFLHTVILLSIRYSRLKPKRVKKRNNLQKNKKSVFSQQKEIKNG